MGQTTRVTEQGGRVRLGDRIFPERFVLTMEYDDGWPELRLDFAVVDGRPQCRGVHVTSSGDGGHEVQSSHLRLIRVNDLLEAVTTSVARRVVSEEGGVLESVMDISDDTRYGTIRQVRQVRKSRITDDVLREVAEVYRANVDNNPTEAVASRFGKAHRTAALYVERARRRGFLGAALKGKAGEQA